MTKEHASEIASILLNASSSDEMFISMSASEPFTLQFAANRIIRVFTTSSINIQITIRKGQQYATAVGNRLDEDGLRSLVASAERQIGRLPERDLATPFQGETSIKPAPIFVAPNQDEGWLVKTAADAINQAKASGLTATGRVSSTANFISLASSNGLFLYQQSSPIHYLVRILNADGTSTGFGETHAYDRTKIESTSVTKAAIDTCLAWENAQEVKAERLTTIFEAQPFAEMLYPFLRQFDIGAYNARRSFLAKLDGSSRLGEKLFDEWVDVFSDPYHPIVPAIPFSSEGIPIRTEHWIKAGVIHTAVRSRFEAAAENAEPVPFPSNYIMNGGEQTLEELISSTKRGLLVRGFANLEVTDPNNCLLTGSTRDGLFLIENGKISKPVQNMVIRETPLYLLRRMEALGIPEKTSPRKTSLPMLVPSIRVTDVMYARVSGIV